MLSLILNCASSSILATHLTFRGNELLIKNFIYNRSIHNNPSDLFHRGHFQIKVVIMTSPDIPQRNKIKLWEMLGI